MYIMSLNSPNPLALVISKKSAEAIKPILCLSLLFLRAHFLNQLLVNVWSIILKNNLYTHFMLLLILYCVLELTNGWIWSQLPVNVVLMWREIEVHPSNIPVNKILYDSQKGNINK